MFLPTETASLVLEGDLLPSFTAVTGMRKGVRTYIPCSTSALPTQGAACDAWRHSLLLIYQVQGTEVLPHTLQCTG